MAWVTENHVKGQEQYKMENVGDYRKVDTTPKQGDEIDGAEPSLPAAEWVRPAGGDLDERYGERAPDESPEGKYPIPSAGDPARWEQAVGRSDNEGSSEDSED